MAVNAIPDLKTFLADKDKQRSAAPPAANAQYAKPGNYRTSLNPKEEASFQQWVKEKKVPYQDSPTADYDMRGFYKAMRSGDPRAKQAKNLHFPDVWKTPYHASFSNESMYANADAPKWQGNQLIDKTGKVVFDENKPRQIPDLKEFLARKQGASAASIGDLQKSFAQKNTKEPESDIAFGMKRLKQAWEADPVGDYLFGKKPTPAAGNAGPTLQGADNGALGKLWDDVRLLPTGTGRNIGEVVEGIFNPLGRTDLQQQVREDQRDAEYKRRTQGMGLPGRLASAAAEGVGENLEGQLSPFNLALIFGTMGGSVAAEAAAEAPSAMAATLGKLAHLGFTVQMAQGTVDAATASVDAFKRGDYESGVKMAVSGLISGVMARAGLHDIDAQQKVKGALDKQAQTLHQKKFADLTPEQKAHAVYEATKTMPLHAEIGGAGDFIERAQREGLAPPAVSEGLNERLEKTLATGARPLAPMPTATPEAFKAGRDVLDVMRKEASAQNRQAAQDEFREKVRGELAQIPNPEKTKLPDAPIVLNAPVYSPWERENIRYENDKATAMRIIETERAAEQARQDRENQLADDARRRAEDTEQEAAYRSGAVEARDRRSQPEVHQQILSELGEREALRSEVGRMYEQHVAALSQMTDGMGFRDTELAAALIRSKRERGVTLTSEENSVLAMHAKREELVRKIAQDKPSARKILDDHIAQQDTETLKNVMAYSERETSLRDAARNLEEQSRLSGTPDAADLLARQAMEAREMAEKVQTERERAQAAQIARHEEKQVVLRGPNMPYTTGNATEVHLPDGRALKARYAAVRLSQLILSHDPFSFRWNDKYEPRRMQPRDLETNENAQAAILVDSKPENYRLERYVTDNPTGLEGPAVILPDGRVAGGNSRLSRLSRRLNEADGREVSRAMAAQFSKFGIEMEDMYDPSDPYVPVRVLEDVPETTQDLIQLGQDLNRDTIMGFSPEEQGVMNADRMTQEDVDGIAAMLDSLPGEPSLRDVLRWRGQQVMDMMVRSGMIPENKRAEFMTSTGELTEKAKDAFESAILGKVINDPNLTATTPPSIMNKVERTLPSLMRLKAAASEWEISDYLKDALRVWKQIDSIRPSLNLIGKDTDSIVDKYFEPEKFPMGTGLMSFGEEEVRPKPHPITYALVKALDRKPLEVKQAFEDYAAPAEGKQSFLLAPPEPYQVFNDTIGRLGEAEVNPADWGTLTPASEEEKAAVARAMEPETKPTKDEQAAQHEMTMPPNVAIAANQVLSAVRNGNVTPQGLRDLFAANPSTSQHADALMEILGRIVPNATGKPLAEFLSQHLADVQAGGEYTGGLAQEKPLGPVWTLKSQQLIDQKMKGPMSGDTVLKMLENNGIKRDELKWMGLAEFLKGKNRVTPEEVKQHLAEGGIQVQEVTKGGPEPPSGYSDWKPEEKERLHQLAESGELSKDEVHERFDRLYDEWNEVRANYELPKYKSYQLPGGENYREMLLTMPHEARDDVRPQMTPDQIERWEALAKEHREAYAVMISPSADYDAAAKAATRYREIDKELDALHAQAVNEQIARKPWKYETPFRSGHWEEPNILAHLRFNDRVTPDGKRLLHIEEIQSDWHQKGRDKGYKDSEKVVAAQKAYDAAQSAMESAHREIREQNAIAEDKSRPVAERNAAHRAYQDANERARKLREEMYVAQDVLDKASAGTVPDAPFKKDWHEMAFRRMVRYAAENGYDGVSWTPGEKQAERYDLSKQISRVKYGKHADPNYPKQHSLVAYDLNGNAVHSGWYEKPEDFTDVIGKEPTRKLLEAEPNRFGVRELSGLDLKVGGEGMKGFYDKIIPDYARKFGKQWGAKVGEASLGDEAMGYKIAERQQGDFIVTDSEGDVVEAAGVQPTRSEAEKWIKDHSGDEVPYLEITPEMRREVTERGVPLFQKEGKKKESVKKGATQFLDDGRALVQLFEHSDPTTVLHEFTHVMRRFLMNEGDRYTLEKFAGVEHGLWDTAAEEKVARAFEKYMHDGDAPLPELRGLFEKMKQVFRDIYGYIRNNTYRLPKESPINIKLSKDVKATFDRWFTGDREVIPETEARPLEMAPPPSSLETVVTPEEREEAVIRANGGNPIADRLSEARLKRFPSLDEAKAWTINNRNNFHGVELYELPNGEAFANFVPKDAKTLFQTSEPQTLAEMIRRVEQIKGLLARETRPEVRERMMADIRRLDAKIGVPSELILAPTPDAPKPLIVPPDLRPEVKPGQVELLFGGDKHETTADRTRRVSDGPVELQNRGRTGEVADLSERPASDRTDGRSAAGDGDRGRGSGEPDRGSVRARGTSLKAVRAAQLAAPKRMRGPATVAPERWAKRMSDLGMPEGLPAPTVKLDDDLQALLIFPGQAEVVESTLSALEQFDGTIIATPTGTGKSYTVMATIKQMMRRQGADRVLVLTKNDSIINGKRKGLKDVGKNTFNLEVQDVPKAAKKIGDGVYATTYATLRNRPDLTRTPWDLVVYDEAAEAANWQESAQGKAVMKLNDVTAKAVYVSATPFATAVEAGYMTKLGLWDSGKFPEWGKQFGVFESRDGKLVGGNEPKKLLKLREQLIERGQFVTQEKSMQGFTAQFAQVPISPEQHQTMKGIITAMKEAALYYEMRQKPELARAVRGNMATFVKSYLERIRLPQTIETVRKMRDQGWKVLIFSETRSSVDKMYAFLKEADEAGGGRLSRAIPRLPGVYEELAKAFGEDQVANFSGAYSAEREGEKEAFDNGTKPILFATYGAGGVGVSLHDDRGNAPRAAVYLGPPWSGKMFDQAMGRAWRYGTKSDVFSVFMVSNAAPETRMILTKVAPRLESLRAAVEGVSDDPMVERMRNLGYNREQLAKYEMGGNDGSSVEELTDLDEGVLLSNYKDMTVPPAEQAKHKGMKYPGQVEDRPGVIQLFQADGTVVVPDRFQTPEERRAKILNEEIAQTLTDGGSLPGVGNALSEIETGQRRRLADEIGPQVAEIASEPSEADPSAAARIAWQNELTKVMAAKAAGEITANPGEGPAWQIRTPGPPETLLGKEESPEPETPAQRDVRPLNWVLSGRENLVRVARQAGVPEIGLKLRRMRDDYHTIRANVAGDFQARYMKLLADNQITPKESRILFMVKEGKMPPPNERIAKAAQGLTDLTLEVQHMLAAKGWKGSYFEDGEAREYSFAQMSDDPRYAPHKHDMNEKISLTDTTSGETIEFTLKALLKKSLPEARREKIIASIQENTGLTKAQIEGWLDAKRRRVPLAGNLERARQADLPFYRMDANVWMEYFEQVGEAAARAEVFGQTREKLDAQIVQIPSAKGRQVVNGIFDGLLSKLPWDQELGKWYSKWGTAQVLSKMTFSAAKVPFHLAHTAVVMENLGSLTKSIFQGVTNYSELKERALFAGVLVDQMKAGAMMEQAAGAKAANAMLKWEGFHWMYSFDRIVANAAAQNWMERYALPRLVKKARSADHIRTQLREKFLMSDKEIDAAIERGRWNQEDLNRGGAALTNRTLFTTDPTELAPAWRARSKEPLHESIGTAVRIATILKGFTFKTAMLIKEDILGEAKRGNYRPLMYAMMVYPVVGEAIQVASASARTIPSALTGNTNNNALTKYANGIEELVKDPSVAKLLHRWIDDVAHATALTVVSEAIDTIAFPAKNKRSSRFRLNQLAEDEASWLAGPYADVFKTADAAYHVLGALTIEEGEKRFREAWKVTDEWAREEFPALRTVLPDPKEKKKPQLARP